MDPEKCLKEAEECLKTDCWDCAYHLADYWKWRSEGGFEPFITYRGKQVKGDTMARSVLISLGEVADTLAEALNKKADNV